MKVKKIYPENLPEINAWLEVRGWPHLTEKLVPKTGFMVEGVACGFLYKTDSSLCWMEWLVTNPQANGQERNTGLDLVIENLLAEAKAWGATAVFTSVQNERLIERYKKHGFQESENNMTNMIKGVESWQ